MTVYVITDVEAGWDCVYGVFYKREDAIDYCKDENGEYDKDESALIIHEKQIQ